MLIYSSWGFFEGICLPGALFAMKKGGCGPTTPVGSSACPWDELQDPGPLEKADVVHAWTPGGLGPYPKSLAPVGLCLG